MYRRIARTLPLLGLLAAMGLAMPCVAAAQDVQGNESDVDFLKRMTTSLKQIERQAGHLEETMGKMSKQAQLDAMSTTNDPLSSRNDRYGSQMRNTTGNRASDYRRAEMRMRSTKKKAIKEREELAEIQRSGETLEPKQRDRIEATVSQLEREVENMNRDMQSGRF